MSRTAFVTNKQLLKEIHESKKTYGEYTDPQYSDYHAIVDDLADVPAEFEVGHVVRVMTREDVPDHKVARGQPSIVVFPPFRHYLKTEQGFVLVGKGQWKGDLNTGEWNTDGQITNELAKYMMLMVNRYSAKANWRNYTYLDEMKSIAIMQLLLGVLKFNEAKSDNPFAYLTTAITNAFTRAWNIEKKQQNIRDETLMMAGYTPSSTRTMDHEHKLELKRNSILTSKPEDVESEVISNDEGELDA